MLSTIRKGEMEMDKVKYLILFILLPFIIGCSIDTSGYTSYPPLIPIFEGDCVVRA